ncbi:MAG TPA: Npt1/Npt2 family nucleotide transporter [Gammaproteobacteria bacterium]|nr:Npt1/Npt2 family nucleotide transporter [Gammaproteobacteria bacterium]
MRADTVVLAAGPERPQALGRALALFANFFFIILAYYQVKAASRSLLIEYGGAEALPYAWVYSALTLVVAIAGYHVIVAKFERVRVVLGSLLVFAGLLVLFRTVFTPRDLSSATAFYVFVDLFSVVLVEQFWSLTDSVSSSEEGRRSFWFVGTGGLVGGVLGGLLASRLVQPDMPFHTPDLLYVCAALLLVVWALNYAMYRAGVYAEVHEAPIREAGDWRVMFRNRYLVLIALLLCCSQLAQPVVEYQFLDMAEREYVALDPRTAFISQFLSLLGLVSIAVNVVVTPLVHRLFGAIGGLLLQPLVLAASSGLFWLSPSLWTAGAMKIGDRGLSYSINRASKELLYIPVDPVLTYQAKAWIDMVGYRLFKGIGSGLILLALKLLPAASVAVDLAWLTIAICTVWALTVAQVAIAYRAVLARA